MAKELKDMTVAEAKATGQEQAYSNLVASYGQGTPDTLIKPNISPGLTPPISVASLTTPIKPIVIPTVKPTSTTNILGQDTDSSIAGLTAETTTQANQGLLNDNLSALIKNIQDQPNQVANITQEEGLTDKNKLRLKTQNEMTALDKKYRDEITDIGKNLQGKLENGVSIEKNIATDRYNNNRANLTIVYNSQLGDYQAALDTVNLKVNALKDSNSQSIQAYQLLANAVNNDLTESQKIQVQANIKDRQDKATMIQGAYASALDLAVKNHAPASVLSAIDAASKAPNATAASIYSALGSYGATGDSAKAPTIQKINGVDMQWNPSTGEWETPSAGEKVGGELSLAQAQSNIQNITELTSGGGMSTAVGTNILSRSPGGFWGTVGKIATVIGIPGLFKDVWKSATGQTQNFISGVEQLQSQLSLDSLIQAKAQGATFGALSDTEMRILASSATKIGSWVERDSNGRAVGYNTTEANFKKELDRINNFAKLDYILKGGNPVDVNVVMLADGSFATQNSDGTYTILQ